MIRVFIVENKHHKRFVNGFHLFVVQVFLQDCFGDGGILDSHSCNEIQLIDSSSTTVLFILLVKPWHLIRALELRF